MSGKFFNIMYLQLQWLIYRDRMGCALNLERLQTKPCWKLKVTLYCSIEISKGYKDSLCLRLNAKIDINDIIWLNILKLGCPITFFQDYIYPVAVNCMYKLVFYVAVTGFS